MYFLNQKLFINQRSNKGAFQFKFCLKKWGSAKKSNNVNLYIVDNIIYNNEKDIGIMKKSEEESRRLKKKYCSPKRRD